MLKSHTFSKYLARHIMKTHSLPKRLPGFTLVELLIVIVIIAVLAAAGLAGGNAALQKARKVTAQSAATTVAGAIEQFYSEYSVLPDPTESATDDNAPYATNQANGTALLGVLSAFEDTLNDRKIRFLNLKEAEGGNRGGIVYNDTGDEVLGLYDPWGQPYYIVLDYNYDERLTFTPQNLSEVTLNGKRVAVYSLGTKTPTDAKRKDLVKTW